MNLMVGDLFGIPVVAHAAVPRDRAYLVGGRLLAGDPGAVVHRVRMEAIKAAMRADLEQLLDAFAARVGVSR